MPLYEYLCPQCGQKRELLARSSDAAVAPRCDACGQPMEKALSLVATCRTNAEGGCQASGGFS